MKVRLPGKAPNKIDRMNLTFRDYEIENTQPNGADKLIFNALRKAPLEEDLKIPYEAKGFEEFLLTCGSAININHTSLKVAEWLCDTLPDGFWDDPYIYKRKFLNPFGDSGFVEKYVSHRLMFNKHMIARFPDYYQRLYHIMHNMIFSVAKTNAISIWQRKIVYYSADCTITEYSIRNSEVCPAMFSGKLFKYGYDIDKLDSYQRTGNIKSPYIEGVVGENDLFDYPLLDWLNAGKPAIEFYATVFWDVFSREDYKTITDERRQKIMAEIVKKLDGYFDVIIGNPPYNTNNKETGQVDKTIYDKFCMAAHELHPKYEAFVIPSKWMSGKAAIADKFPQTILRDNADHVNYIKLVDGKEAFPSVDTGEIVIYAMDNTKKIDKLILDDHDKISEHNSMNDITYEVDGKRWMIPHDSIITKIEAKKLNSLADDCKTLRLKSGIIYNNHNSDLITNGNVGFKYDYGKSIILPDGTAGCRPTLDYSLVKTDKYSLKYYMTNVKLWKRDSAGVHERPNQEDDKMISHIFIDSAIIKDYCGNKFNHNVLVTTTVSHYGERLLDYPYNSFIMKPNEIANWFIVLGASLKTNEEVQNLKKYIQTKFVTYLITINTKSQNFTSEVLRFVPAMDFTREWTDNDLNKYFELSDDEITRINNMWDEFRPMSRHDIMSDNEENGDVTDA